MSSPTINNIINFNCLLLYLCPIFNAIKGLNLSNQDISNAMCQFNAWIIPISSTTLYAAMLTKAWRIFKIFDTSPKMKKVVIKDYHLVAYIFMIAAVDLIVIFVWQFYDTIRVKMRYVYEGYQQSISDNDYADSSANNNTLDLATAAELKSYNIKLLYECNSNLNEVWITVLTIYKLILMMYGIYLAWLIRNVTVPSMNDSKYLLLSTYTIIVSGLGSMTLIQVNKRF